MASKMETSIFFPLELFSSAFCSTEVSYAITHMQDRLGDKSPKRKVKTSQILRETFNHTVCAINFTGTEAIKDSENDQDLDQVTIGRKIEDSVFLIYRMIYIVVKPHDQQESGNHLFCDVKIHQAQPRGCNIGLWKFKERSRLRKGKTVEKGASKHYISSYLNSNHITIWKQLYGVRLSRD